MERYRVIASKKQLMSIGIDYDIRGLIGELTNRFSDEYYGLKITHSYCGYNFTNLFDIPKRFLMKIDDGKR